MQPLTLDDQRRYPGYFSDYLKKMEAALLTLIKDGPEGVSASIYISSLGKIKITTKTASKFTGNKITSIALEKHNRRMEALFYHLRTFVEDHLL